MAKFNGYVCFLATIIEAFFGANSHAATIGQTALSDPIAAANRNDAGLNSLFVLSADRVWAVGDRGQILVTENGGAEWWPQLSGTTANLYAVHFANAERGWCVGGWIDPLTRQSTGIVLSTQDGGETWNSYVPTGLPRLLGLGQIGLGRLAAWGDYSPHMAACMFESPDGIAWNGVKSNSIDLQAVGWNGAGEWLSIDSRGLVTRNGRRTATESLAVSVPTSPMRAMTHNGTSWIAVGDRGRVLNSRDAANWHEPVVPLSELARRACHWRCAASHGDHVWIAGYPGSITLCSSDRGETWRAELNPFPVPRNSLAFADCNRGWAVGPNGAIFATRDGGANWFVQRQSWQRLAVLSVSSRSESVPWPALVVASWDQRLATASLVVHAQASELAGGFPPAPASFLSQIAPRFGVAQHSTWCAYPFSDLRVDGPRQWKEYYHENQSANATSLSAIEYDLAIAYQTWQPSVVLTSSATSAHQIDRLLAKSAFTSTQLAAGVTGSEIAAISHSLGLQPWRIGKVIEVTESGTGRFSISAEHILRGAGVAVEDVLRPLISWERPRLQECSMRTIPQEFLNPAAYESLLGGIAIGPESVRQVRLDNVGNYQLVVARAQREAAIDRLLAQETNSTDSPERWSSQLEFLIRTLPKHDVAYALMRIARDSLKKRDWYRVQHALELLADSGEAADAQRWSNLQTAKLLGCDELCAWMNASRTDIAEGIPLAETSSVVRADWELESPFGKSGVVTGANTVVPDVSPVQQASYSARVPALEARFRSWQPHYATDLQASIERLRLIDSQMLSINKNPDKLLLQQARVRRLAEFSSPAIAPSTEWLEIVAGERSLDGYSQAAANELRLLSGQSNFLSRALKASRASQPPLLDGKLDDEVWSHATAGELANGYEGPEHAPAHVKFGYDDQYLYLAIECPRRQRSTVDREQRKRHYDMNLVGTDHVHILLDTDRDYATSHELGINEFGETYDRCLGFQEWNPACFVWVDRRQDCWRAEAAISLKDLTMRDDLAGRAWAISVFRFVPQQGIESWNNGALQRPLPQGSGLLLMER